MVHANSKPLIFTRTTEANTQSAEHICSLLPLAGEGLGMRGR